MLPHGAGIPGGTVPFRYGEARGIFSFEKRMSPRPPKEKRGGISISPRTPLKRHKGAKLRFLPFGNPSKDKGSGSGKRSRGCPICTPTSCDDQHGVQDLISSAPRPCYAGTDKSLGRTVENRIPQTCACRKFGQKRLFSSTVHGAFSFPQEEKRMGGVFQQAKPI